MWWHGWKREENIQELAGALMIGHIIECSTYAVSKLCPSEDVSQN